jgi:hypothetical protein
MSNLPLPAVLAGMAAGIGLIMIFALTFTAQPREESASVSLGNQIYVVPYSFSEPNAKMLDFTVDQESSSALMKVDVPVNTQLAVRFPLSMLQQLQGSDPGERVEDDFAIFVDEVPPPTAWIYADNEAILTIWLDSGAQSIEIAEGSLL